MPLPIPTPYINVEVSALTDDKICETNIAMGIGVIKTVNSG